MKTDVHDVTVEVTVPAGTSEEAVADMVARCFGSAEHDARQIVDDPDWDGDGDCARLVTKSEFSVRSSCYDRSEGTDLDCSVDVDEAEYIGDPNDGVYYQVFEDDDGKFWMSAIVDCNTSGFVDSLTTQDGPYDSVESAEAAGRNAALEWCGWNDVDTGDGNYD